MEHSVTKNLANADVYKVFLAPRVGLEPTTPRLTAVCSTIELSRTTSFFSCCTLKTSYRIPTDLPQTFFSSLWLALWPSLRPISGSPLHALLHFHSCPIYLVVSQGPYPFGGYLILGRASRLDAFSAYPSRAWLPCCGFGTQQVHQRPVQPGPLVLRPGPLRYPPPAPDRDRTVSRRSEPSSRTALMGEQPNPWDLLQPQDAMSRHRGAKPLRRCELLGVISLLSPG